ncbi:MAG: SAM-dependent chlorinase/fluorinase [Anaerolineae bacterium]|nr:SAM-dependent chlorinase/fluorinase [Anaerolineae bacterium]
MTCITYTTDFGTKDGYDGVMKGVVHGIVPHVAIYDISHEISPQNIQEGGLVLAEHAFYFPPGTVHIIVVDPGVGTKRRAIAARVGEYFFVAPDNGVLSRVFAYAEEQGWPISVVSTDNPEYWLDQQSNTFHGRDIFSPVGAHLASGVPLKKLGTTIFDAVRIEIPKAKDAEGKVSGEVIHIDHFGNLCTNINENLLKEKQGIKVHIAGKTITGLVKSFGYSEYDSGELIALIDSTGFLSISENKGSGYQILQCKVGEPVEITYK